MPALVRSASLTHFVDVTAQCGLDGRALARGVGLPARCLDDPDLKVPARQVGRLLELAAERAKEPAFGLRMAESRRLSNLGPLALLVRDEPTLRSALEALLRHIHLHNEAVAVQVEQVGNLVAIREELDPEGATSVRQATELVVGVTFRVLQVFMGSPWRPRLCTSGTRRRPAWRFTVACSAPGSSSATSSTASSAMRPIWMRPTRAPTR